MHLNDLALQGLGFPFTCPRPNLPIQNAYLARYRSRLKGRNILYIGQIQHVLQALSRFLSRYTKQRQKVTNSGGATGARTAASGDATGAAGPDPRARAGCHADGDDDGTYRINDLLFKLGIDNLNLFKVSFNVSRSNVVRCIVPTSPYCDLHPPCRTVA